MSRWIAFAAVALSMSSAAVPARACPKCAAGIEARDRVLGEHFGRNLAVALLPFVIIGGICLRAEKIGRRARTERETSP